MKKLYYQILTSVLLLLFGVSVNAQGIIEGMVSDNDGEPVVGATVLLKGTTTGTLTDFNGKYSLKVPTGEGVLRISFTGFKPQTFEFSIKNGETITRNFTLHQDLLSLDQVVVTGVQNEKTKLESSVAITSLDAKKIESESPRNTADLLKTVPGFYVESSGGEGGNNLFVRGIPADGSFRYVQLQEDGMPVFNATEAMFFNIDVGVRVDNNIERMESVRGGSSAIFASNAPGGIVNYISKTGSQKFKGSTKISVGDYGMFRTDVELGGPINDKLTYHVGGFYRSDQGIRPTEFTANEGGQIKANLTYHMDKGYFKLYGKYLNDKNVFYLPIPLSGLDEELEGFDANYGTMTSRDLLYLNVKKPLGRGYQEENLSEGMHPIIKTLGGEVFYEITDRLTVKDHFKRSTIDHQFNAIFSLNDPMTAEAYAQAQGIANPVWSYARGNNAGVPITNIANLNNNGLVVDVGWWAVTMPLNDFANDLSLTYDISDNNKLSVGYWFSNTKQEAHWWWHNVLMEVAENPRALNLQDGNSGTFYTDNGYSKYGSNYLNYYFTDFVNAFYVNEEITLGDLTIDAGLRYEIGDITGYTENTETYDMGNAQTMADDAVLYGNGTYETWNFDYDELAWSVGLNYKFNDNLAAFGRASNGFRAPDDNNLVFSNAEGARVEDIYQYELGGKYSSENIAAFGTLFYSLLNDFPFSDEVLNTDGTVSNSTRYADATATGLELELRSRFGNFGVDLTGTFQDLTYKDYIYTRYNDPNDPADNETFDFEGNQVRRIPKIYYTLTPYYSSNGFRVNVAIQHFGDRYSDDANSENAKLPAFTQLNAGVSYAWNNFELAVRSNNITNTIGLTEGNPRTESVFASEKPFRMARPIMGRSIIGSLIYKF
jgi:outer membrane receptor protein involved in Fe transport